MQEQGFKYFPKIVNFLLFIAGAYGLTTANPLLSLFTVAVLMLLPRLVWLTGHPPVLLVCMILQWLQASTKVFQANSAGQDVNTYTGSLMAVDSIISANVGILFIALGINLTIKKTGRIQLLPASDTRNYNIDKAFKLFFIFFGLSMGISAVIYVIPGLAQVLLSAVYIKWILYCLVFYLVFTQKQKYHYAFIIFLTEFAYNSFGFYSSFKEVIFMTAILLGTFFRRVNIALIVVAIPVLFVLVNVFTIWTGIKGEYRTYLLQNNTASIGEKLDYMSTLYNEFDDFNGAWERSLERLSYTNMLMYSMETIPSIRPHENGALWLGALEHILMPRILFPNKRVLNDSEKANAYTGREWAGVDKGTSISIGYITESYVDFGRVGMFIPLLILGLLVGSIYRKFLSYNFQPVILFALLVPPIYFTKFGLIENSNDKLLGALIMNFIVFSLFVKYGMSYVLNYLKDRKL